jgi:hypothetical protein
VTKKVPHIDPTDTAVAAILKLDVDGFGNDLSGLAAALEPAVAAAPALPEYSEDDEWTAAEEAVCVAKVIVAGVRDYAKDSSKWWSLLDQAHRLQRMQRAHIANEINDKLGAFPGFLVVVRCGWQFAATIEVYPSGAMPDRSEPLFLLPSDVTRREVEMAIRGWKAGNDKGLRDGALRIRLGIRELLEIEAA